MLDYPFVKEITIIFIVIGGGFFGYKMGELFKRKVIEKNPGESKRIAIEQNDERNKAMLYMAKSRAFDIMISIIGLVILVLGLLGHLDKVGLGALIFIFILAQGILLYQIHKVRQVM